MIFRPNNEVVRVIKGGEFTRLSIIHWSITEGNKIKLTDFDDYAESDILQLAENDLVFMETNSYSKVKVHFQGQMIQTGRSQKEWWVSGRSPNAMRK